MAQGLLSGCRSSSLSVSSGSQSSGGHRFEFNLYLAAVRKASISIGTNSLNRVRPISRSVFLRRDAVATRSRNS